MEEIKSSVIAEMAGVPVQPLVALRLAAGDSAGAALADMLVAGLGQVFNLRRVPAAEGAPDAALVLDMAAPPATGADGEALARTVDFATFQVNAYRSGPVRFGWIGDAAARRGEVLGLLLPAMGERHQIAILAEDASPASQAEFLRQIDVLVLTSDADYAQQAALNAAACGVFPVAVRQGALGELLAQYALGRLADADGAALHAALNWCADQADEMRRLAYAQAQALALQPVRLPQLGAWRRFLQHALPAGSVASPAARRPRILILADVRGWIFERHAQFLQQQLADAYQIEIDYLGSQVDDSQWDLVYPLEWKLIPAELIRNRAKWITGIRSHVSWEQYGMPALAAYLQRHYAMVHVVSERLAGLLAGAHPRLRVLSHGIRIDHFSTDVPQRSEAGVVRVGWAGNSAVPLKGFAQFIEPLGKLAGVSLKYFGYSNTLLDMAAMKGFYEELDVYVCCSLTEGNNNSLMEAAAMGRAIVTTDVGTVPEYLVDGESALIVPRELAAFEAAVARLRDDPALRLRLGAAAREAVKRFSWERKLQEHRVFFDDALRLAGAAS